jgi:hypothetical protein
VNWRRLAREPLVHFLLGGLAIFAAVAWRGEPADPASRTIRLTQDDQAQLALSFEQMMSRPPTQAELDALIDRWVHDEVLYREALRLGLDEGDPVIRRRLGQKMDVIAASAADAEQPSDSDLQRWLERHPDRFARDTALSFDQLYFGSEAAALAAKARLQGAADWRELGQAVSLPQSLDAAPRSAVADQFGEDFVRALEGARQGRWLGPVETPLGWHLVRLRARKPGALPALAEVRQRVEDDWRSETERARKDAGFKLLRDAYTVEIDR